MGLVWACPVCGVLLYLLLNKYLISPARFATNRVFLYRHIENACIYLTITLICNMLVQSERWFGLRYSRLHWVSVTFHEVPSHSTTWVVELLLNTFPGSHTYCVVDPFNARRLSGPAPWMMGCGGHLPPNDWTQQNMSAWVSVPRRN